MGDEAGARARLVDLEQLACAGTFTLRLSDGTTHWSEGEHRLHGTVPGAVGSIEDWVTLVHPEDVALWRRTLDEAIEPGRGYTLDHRIVRADDGRVRWLRSRARVEGDELLGVSLDTTRDHDDSDTLRTFLADAAHELRTPAAAIGQAVGALPLVGDEERGEVLEILARQAARLRTLTTDLVDLAQLDAGPVAIVLGPVPLDGAVEVALEHAPPPAGRTVRCDLPSGVDVLATAGHLDRVLVNLLTNAYRYGGPTIRVTGEVRGDRVVVEVADDGEGVPPQAVEGLFHAFRRGPQRHPEASGLGLAIVSRLVHRFGGTASYRPGDPGAVFVLDLERASTS
jgi:signal transduction histidine kinase